MIPQISKRGAPEGCRPWIHVTIHGFLCLLIYASGAPKAPALPPVPDDWREEKIIPPMPTEPGGFMALSSQADAETDADPAQGTAAGIDALLSPFGQPEDESETYSIDAIEALYLPAPPDPGFESLDLRASVLIALERNFGLQNNMRNLASSSSSRREALAEFIPFVNLMWDFSTSDSRRERTRRFQTPEERRESERDGEDQLRNVVTRESSHGLTAQQNLPWGGNVQVVVDRDRTEVKENFFIREGLNDTRDEDYATEVRVAYDQPLLRDAGWAVGTTGLKNARLDEMDSAMDFDLRRRDVALNIIRNYYDVQRSKLDIEVSRAALRETSNFLSETRLRYELGQIPESEISRAEIRFLQEKQRFVTRQQSLQQAIDDLLTELGLPLRRNIVLSGVEGQLVDLRRAAIPPLDDGIAEALANRLELLRSQIGVERAKNSLRQSANAVLPELNLEASWSGFEESENFSSSEDLEIRRVVEWGLNLNVPFPNIERREQLYRAKLRLETAENDFADQERTIVSDVKAAYRNLRASELSTQILAKTVEQSRRSLILENARFEAGLNSSTEVRNAQDDLFQAQADYNQALLQMQVDIARVYRGLGRSIF